MSGVHSEFFLSIQITIYILFYVGKINLLCHSEMKMEYISNINFYMFLLVVDTRVSFGTREVLRLCLEPRKVLGKGKNVKENDFLMFGYMVENLKENQI